jgi:hypothetical protein
MSLKIIILNTNTHIDGSFNVSGVFWLEKTTNLVPFPDVKSQIPNVTQDQLALLQSGSLVEVPFVSGQFSYGTTLLEVQADLQSLYDIKQAELNNIAASVDGFVGQAFDGTSWSTVSAPLNPQTQTVQLQYTQQNNIPVFAEAPRIGDEVIYSTHNLCDPCTWFGDSVRVSENLVDAGDHIKYSGTYNNWIDMISGRLQDDDGLVEEQRMLNPSDPHGYQVVVAVNGVTKTMREPFELSGGDYEVYWEDGYVKFFTPLSPTDTVSCSYSHATTSTFYLRPLPGKDLHIEAAESDFTHDIVMTDGIEYNVYGYVDVFAPQYMYKRLTGTATFVNGAQTVTGTGTLFSTEVTPGKYIRLETDGPESYMIVASVQSNTSLTLAAPYSGTSSTATIAYCDGYTGIYPSLTKIPLSRTRYKRLTNIIQEAIGAYPNLPVVGSSDVERNLPIKEFRRQSRGMMGPTQSVPFRYATLRTLQSAYGLELRVTTSHDRAIGGESVTLTFYCTSHNANNPV